jgi:hypothetical protein
MVMKAMHAEVVAKSEHRHVCQFEQVLFERVRWLQICSQWSWKVQQSWQDGVEMGVDVLPGGLSPAHRRSGNPLSPAPFKRSQSRIGDEPDLGWRSLAQRHQFLLSMLGILAFLCTVYLYFAVTLGTKDLCSGLGGGQRALCQLNNKVGNKISEHYNHRATRRLLLAWSRKLARSCVLAIRSWTLFQYSNCSFMVTLPGHLFKFNDSVLVNKHEWVLLPGMWTRGDNCTCIYA